MSDQKLSEDMLSVLRIIKENGSSVCVGTCEHRKPGELHCQAMSFYLKISASGIKRRLKELVRLGFLNWERKEREDGKVMAVYTLSPEGLNQIEA